MLQYFDHLMQRAESLEKTLMLGKIEGKRRRAWKRMRSLRWHHQLNGHEFEQTPGNRERQGNLMCYSSWNLRIRHDLVTEQQHGKYTISLRILAFM